MKVLVATDGSASSEAALDMITNKPWPKEANFKVVSVVEPLHSKLDALFVGGLGDMSRRAQAAYQADIENVLSQSKTTLAGKFGQDAVSSEVLAGSPADQIIQAAKTFMADLIIMGGHFSSAEGWYGSVARGVTIHAPCSVRIVHPDSSGSMAKKEEFKEDPNETRLLIAVSSPADADLLGATSISREWPEKSRVQVLSVVPPFHNNARFGKTKDWQDVAEKAETAAKEHGETLVETVAVKVRDKFGKENVTCHVLHGSPRSLILQVAQDWGSDLILMGAHSKDKSLMERVVGSTAAAVVLNAPCSVELEKHK
jgi:nucleotide-binding universal stress UspA family protein